MSVPPFQITVARAPEADTVYLSGSIDLAASLALMPELDEMIRQCGNELRFDLAGVTFMDSEGLKALIAASAGMQAKSGRARVVRCSRCVARILALTGLDQVLDVEIEPAMVV